MVCDKCNTEDWSSIMLAVVCPRNSDCDAMSLEHEMIPTNLLLVQLINCSDTQQSFQASYHRPSRQERNQNGRVYAHTKKYFIGFLRPNTFQWVEKVYNFYMKCDTLYLISYHVGAISTSLPNALLCAGLIHASGTWRQLFYITQINNLKHLTGSPKAS